MHVTRMSFCSFLLQLFTIYKPQFFSVKMRVFLEADLQLILNFPESAYSVFIDNPVVIGSKHIATKKINYLVPNRIRAH